jgi:hypothetical protein
MKYIITESQSNKNLKPLLEKLGMKTLCEMTSRTPKEIINEMGIKGTKEDIIFLTKTIFENDISPVLTYCKYVIIPTQYSMDLVVYIPKPAPENVGRYMFDQGTRNVYRDVISEALYKFGGGIIRGHNIEVHNTGDC